RRGMLRGDAGDHARVEHADQPRRLTLGRRTRRPGALAAAAPALGSDPHRARCARQLRLRARGCGGDMALTRPPVDGGTVLITGASSGIGRELAVALAARAKALVLLARRTGLLEELGAELRARHPGLDVVVLRADLSDEADV